MFALFIVPAFFCAEARFQEPALNLQQPLRRCRVYGGTNGSTKIIASDNNQNLIITTDGFSIVSINAGASETGIENWKTLSGGRLESETIDAENLYFVTSFSNDDRKQVFTLNSISLKTGVTNWQTKLEERSGVKLNPVENSEYIFLTADNKFIKAFRKSDGKTIWTKEYPGTITAVSNNEAENDSLGILLEDGLRRVSMRTGTDVADLRLRKTAVSSSLIGKEYVLIGYPNGEVSRTDTTGNRLDTIWKVKTGGGVTGLLKYRKDVLVTSLDNFIYMYSLDRGNLKWKKRLAGRIIIKPRIFGELAAVINSGDEALSFFNLEDGKIVNQLKIEPGDFFTGEPFLVGDFLFAQTTGGIYFFSNTGKNCR